MACGREAGSHSNCAPSSVHQSVPAPVTSLTQWQAAVSGACLGCRGLMSPLHQDLRALRSSPTPTPRPARGCMTRPTQTHTTHKTRRDTQTPSLRNTHPQPPPQAVPPPPRPPPPSSEHRLTAQRHPPASTTPAPYRRARPRTPSPTTTKGHPVTQLRTQQQRPSPPPPTPPPSPHAAPPAAAPAEPPW